jgi:hypothetical protein
MYFLIFDDNVANVIQNAKEFQFFMHVGRVQLTATIKISHKYILYV